MFSLQCWISFSIKLYFLFKIVANWILNVRNHKGQGKNNFVTECCSIGSKMTSFSNILIQNYLFSYNLPKYYVGYVILVTTLQVLFNGFMLANTYLFYQYPIIICVKFLNIMKKRIFLRLILICVVRSIFSNYNLITYTKSNPTMITKGRGWNKIC